jgi:hypothetical protein
MMRCSGGGEIGAIGPGDKFFYTMGLHALINHSGQHCPTAAKRPNSQDRSTPLSAKMLGNMFFSLKLDKIIINYVYISYSKVRGINKFL